MPGKKASLSPKKVKSLLQRILPSVKISSMEEFLVWGEAHLPLVHIFSPKKGTLRVLQLSLHFPRGREQELIQEIKQQVPLKKEPVFSLYKIPFALSSSYKDFQERGHLFFSLMMVDLVVQNPLDERKMGARLLQLVEGKKEVYAGRYKPAFWKERLQAFAYLELLIGKFPRVWGEGLFQDYEKLVVTSCLSKERGVLELCRIACGLHYVTKVLSCVPKESRKKEGVLHLFLKKPLAQEDQVWGLVVGIAPFSCYEFLEEERLVQTIQKFLPCVKRVEGSFYSHPVGEPLRVVYLELKTGRKLTGEQVVFLKRFLVGHLLGRIEKRTPSLFIVRNEEEVLRTIILLSRELKYVRDLPQVKISWEKQTETHLVFTVVVVRLLLPHLEPFEKICLAKEGLSWEISRSQVVGHLRKRHLKEATVLSVSLEKSGAFFREDGSIHVSSAREKVLSFLQEMIGEVRDYTGGMLAKQRELLRQFTQRFPQVYHCYPDFMENFFYAITPLEMQAILPLACLVALFQLLWETLQNTLDSDYLTIQEEEYFLYVLIKTESPSLISSLLEKVETLKILPQNLARTEGSYPPSYFLGYIYRKQDLYEEEQLLRSIRGVFSQFTSLK